MKTIKTFFRWCVGRAVLDRSRHAVGDLGNQRGNIEVPLDAGLEIGNVVRRGRMLHVVKRPAVGDRRNHRSQLQRRHGYALSKRAHLPHAAQFRRDFLLGINAEVLAVDVVTRQLAQSKLVRVIADLVKPEFASQRLEIRIVRARQSVGEIHAAATAKRDRRVFVDEAFTQSCERDRDFDGRTGLRAARQRQLLIHHGENAATGWLDRHHGSIHVAQRIDGGLPHDRIFARNDIAFGYVFRERAGVEAFVVAMPAMVY